MEATAAQNFFSTAPEGEYDASKLVSLSASRYCSCGGSASSCSIACSNEPPDVFYDLGAQKTYSGMLLPDLNLNAEMRVRLR